MKSRLIVNPVAGADAGPDYLPTINQQLRARFTDLDIVITVAPTDATRAAAEAARAGYEQLFIAGGDGTLNEVLNGMASVEGALDRVTFGLIPLGTGNDFAAALGLPEDVTEAIELLLIGRSVAVDVGLLNDRYFINVSAGGFIAEVSDAVNPQLKTLAGKFAYLLGGAQVLFDYEEVGVQVRVTGERGQVSELAMGLEMFAVCNSRRLGGGQMMAPRALINDGLLDLCLFAAMPMIDFLTLLPRVSSGTHLDDERVTYLRASELEMRFDRPIKVNTDGEVLETDHCFYRVLPQAARFLCGDAPFAIPR
jgi:diacylglycerol kinase (ATP)